MSSPLRTVVLAAACLLAPGLPSQSLQFADGKVLLAHVEDADGQGLRVRRLDNGGLLDLRWDQLSAASALAIKRRFDLAGDAQDEVLMRADEIEYLQNGSKQTLIGKVTDRTPEQLIVQAKGIQYRVPRADLRTIRPVDVPVMQVLTKDEFYGLKSAELQPGDSADKHMLFADQLLKVRDYEHAAEHLAKAKELGNSADPQRLESMLQRLQRYKEAAKERELLDQIQACRSRAQLGDFEKGTRLIEQFAKDFPQSKLKVDFEQEKKRFADARVRFLSQQVADQWRNAIRVVADKKAAEETATLQAARDYAENKMTDDIVARLQQQFRIDAAEIKQLWADRARFPVGKRAEHFAYGIGSWILGEQGILKGTEAGKQRDKQQPAAPEGNDRDVERLAKLFRQAMERRRAAVQGSGGGAQQEQTDEDWWAQASRAERTGWLRAYYAEFGGQLVVTFQTVSPCISCYGEGSTPDMGPDGKMTRQKCFLCQGTKWLRSFRAY
jgi:hypothetical protein